VAEVVRQILPKLSTLSSRFHLIILVGHQENVGQKLVSVSVAEQMETELDQAVRAADPGLLAEEWDLLRLLYWVQNRAPEGETALPTLDNLGLNTKILSEARAESTSW
jgi:hypothetical protein